MNSELLQYGSQTGKEFLSKPDGGIIFIWLVMLFIDYWFQIVFDHCFGKEKEQMLLKDTDYTWGLKLR